jgi:hypothetical protein
MAHMNLTPFVDTLRHELAVAAAAGGDEAQALAERLAGTLDAAARLMLLEALTTAAEEITCDLAPGSVEVRLRGRDPEFVVESPPTDETRGTDVNAGAAAGATVAPARFDDDGGTARLNLRLPESLKQSIEEAARSEGLSLNAWIVRATAAALEPDGARRSGPTASGGQRYSGWAR